MDVLRYLIGEEGEEDEGLLASMIGQGVGHFRGLLVNGELSHEKVGVLAPAYDATLSLAKMGLAAMRIFGNDVPDDIGEEITTAIENLRGTMAGYMGGQVDAAGVKAAIKEGRTRATEIRKALKTPRT
jgi:hypothetical protein